MKRATACLSGAAGCLLVAVGGACLAPDAARANPALAMNIEDILWPAPLPSPAVEGAALAGGALPLLWRLPIGFSPAPSPEDRIARRPDRRRRLLHRIGFGAARRTDIPTGR